MWCNGDGDLNNDVINNYEQFDVFDFSLQNNMQQGTESSPAPVTVSTFLLLLQKKTKKGKHKT